MSEPRSNIAFAAQLQKDGVSDDEIQDRLEGRGLSAKEARKILRKLSRSENKPSPVLAWALVAVGSVMIVFGLWVIVNAYQDPEVMEVKTVYAGHGHVGEGRPLLNRMWRLTLMCWICGGAVLSTGLYKVRRTNAKPPPQLTPLPPPPGYENAGVEDMKRYATKERVKGRLPEDVVREIMGMGAGQELAKKIVGLS